MLMMLILMRRGRRSPVIPYNFYDNRVSSFFMAILDASDHRGVYKDFVKNGMNLMNRE
jgi:hypothetical protein